MPDSIRLNHDELEPFGDKAYELAAAIVGAQVAQVSDTPLVALIEEPLSLALKWAWADAPRDEIASRLAAFILSLAHIATSDIVCRATELRGERDEPTSIDVCRHLLETIPLAPYFKRSEGQ